VNTKRVVTMLAWAMAMLLPGGLPLLALWMAFKAARARQHPAGQLAGATARVSS
jgi:hypothetical protein